MACVGLLSRRSELPWRLSARTLIDIRRCVDRSIEYVRGSLAVEFSRFECLNNEFSNFRGDVSDPPQQVLPDLLLIPASSLTLHIAGFFLELTFRQILSMAFPSCSYSMNVRSASFLSAPADRCKAHRFHEWMWFCARQVGCTPAWVDHIDDDARAILGGVSKRSSEPVVAMVNHELGQRISPNDISSLRVTESLKCLCSLRNVQLRIGSHDMVHRSTERKRRVDVVDLGSLAKLWQHRDGRQEA